MSTAQMPVTMSSLLRQMPSVRIVSIAPVEFTARVEGMVKTPHGEKSGMRDYVLAAAARGAWTYVEIDPDLIKLPQFDDESQTGSRHEYEDPTARAQKLASYWRYAGAVAGGRLTGTYGIMALEPGQLEPTAEQLAQMTREQERLANSMVSHANGLDERGENGLISDIHRRMAKWLLGNNAEALPWYGRKDFGMQKTCVACAAQIPESATKCKTCGEDLVERYIRNGPEGTDDPIVTARAKSVMEHRAKAAAPKVEPVAEPVAVAAPPTPRPVVPPGIPPPPRKD